MFKPLAVAFVAAFTLQPALAAPVLGDYDVYTDNETSIAGGGSYGDIASTGFSNAGGVFTSQVTPSAADRAALTGTAESLSQAYAAMTETAYNFTGNKFNRVLHGVSGLNVITLSQAEADSFAFKLTFVGGGATGLILNIPGFEGSLVDYTVGGIAADQVLFNFFEATKVSGADRTIPGTILAPLAKISVSGSKVAGSIVGDSFKSANTQVAGAAFSGFFPGPAVPEPATWALLILGFGMVGAAMRRRQARPAFV